MPKKVNPQLQKKSLAVVEKTSSVLRFFVFILYLMEGFLFYGARVRLKTL